MKFSVPEISWHNRDPVLSADFQPCLLANSEPRRLATAGTDTHVLIWYVSVSETGAVSLEVAADLARHQKAVNIVRWAPNGELLASGDDEAVIFVWKQRTDKDPPPIFDQTDEQDRETWIIYKTLRGHMEDILDISWDAGSMRLASGSVDNKLLCWDVGKGKSTAILADHKGFVQGVAWDPSDQYLASISSDRVFRTFDIATKKVSTRSSKAVLPVPRSHPLHRLPVRLYYDDTLQTYFRRLHFSPDGLLVAVPSGHVESDSGQLKPINAVFIYSRYALSTPACMLPCGDTAALVVRWSPVQYKLRPGGPAPAFPLPRRMILAVATKTTIILYDTQQKTPIAIISNIHYTRLTDLTWSPDGQILVASSTDGFCSVISFSENELGEKIDKDLNTSQNKEPEIAKSPPKETKSDIKAQKTPEAKKIEVKGNRKLQAFMQFKIPSEKSTKPDKAASPADKNEPITIDLSDETANAPWSEDSNSGMKSKANITPMVVDEESEDIKLVYEDSQSDTTKGDSPKETEVNKRTSEPNTKIVTSKSPPSTMDGAVSPPRDKVSDVKPALKAEPTVTSSPKTPRRVSFVTLSSPKNPKKKC